MVSDRDLLIAIFNAIGALAKRLTGDTLVVAMRHDDYSNNSKDDVYGWNYASPILTKWDLSKDAKSISEEVLSLCAENQESDHKPVELQNL